MSDFNFLSYIISYYLILYYSYFLTLVFFTCLLHLSSEQVQLYIILTIYLTVKLYN